MKNHWIQIGIVGKPQGLRGAFFIAQRDDVLPSGLKSIRIGADPAKAKSFIIQECRRSGHRSVIQCQELQSREAAEAVKMQAIWCERIAIGLEEKSEYLWADLIGKNVKDSEGLLLGRIVGVGNFGASDVVRIENETPAWIELPFVAYYFDMSFRSGDIELRLVVKAETFAEQWAEG